MIERSAEKERRKRIVKDIILKLHQGVSAEEAKDRFVREVGNITSTEIAEIEQSLINEGLSPDQIKRFCNVHALLFESALKDATTKEESPAHPVRLFKLENREIEKLANSLKELMKARSTYNASEFKTKTKDLLSKLTGVNLHYTRKEQLLFPFLERYGFTGPSKVMWGKDDEIRGMLKDAAARIEESGIDDEFIQTRLNPLIDEIEGMIFKEENILFPTSLEKLKADDWLEILKDSEEVGYAFIEKPKDAAALVSELRSAVTVEPKIEGDDVISLPTGDLRLKELMAVLDTLPVDVTFIDEDDRVKYFSAGAGRIFVRTKSVIGRKVQNCHPPQSVEVVERILSSFKEGKKDFVEFWIRYMGKSIHIRYFAVRERSRQYLGTLEVTQDITNIRKLEGEKRLLDEGD
jgi:PAS domain S-box-containing protein